MSIPFLSSADLETASNKEMLDVFMAYQEIAARLNYLIECEMPDRQLDDTAPWMRKLREDFCGCMNIMDALNLEAFKRSEGQMLYDPPLTAIRCLSNNWGRIDPEDQTPPDGQKVN